MILKAVLFEFNGAIIKDEPICQQLIDQILIEENLRPKPGEYRQVCLGRSDRACLTELLTRRGRVVSEIYLTQLLKRKAGAYQQQVEKLEKLPLYPGLDDLIFQLRSQNLKLAVVSGGSRCEVELVLNRAALAEHFTLIIAGDDLTTSQPELDGCLLAVERLNQLYPGFNLNPSECLAIEGTPAGIQAAKRAGIPVVGVATIYPFHMLQRQANWTIDYLCDLELERLQQVYAQSGTQESLA